MPIELSWHTPNRIILMVSSGDITIQESIDANTHALELLDESDSPVHVIVDQSAMGDFPVDIRRYREIFSAVHHASVGWIVVYGIPSRVSDFIITLLTRMAGIRYHKAGSASAAIAFLKSKDPTLRELISEHAG